MHLDQDKIPNHIAIIMDGNGRWAAKRNLPKIAGHREGIKAIENVLKASRDLGVKILTLYVFSTENWNRPKDEVSALMRLMDEYIDRELERLAKEGVRINTLGNLGMLPAELKSKLENSVKRTKDNKGVLLNLAVSYGARQEIVDACRSIAGDVLDKKLEVSDIDQDLFNSRLYTRDIPDPDLLIRTSGEMRMSNFLLWQISYAEIYVTETLWPDFNRSDLEKAIEAYQGRERRFGRRC